MALSTFSYNICLCVTANACILVQSHVSGLDIRTAWRHKVNIKDAQDCWSNSRALCEKFSAHTSEAHAHRQPRQLCVNTELSSPPLFCVWMNKYRQNYIKMHILANILVNSRLWKACLNVNSGEKRHAYQYIKSVLSFLKWNKTNNKYNAVKQKYKWSLLLTK